MRNRFRLGATAVLALLAAFGAAGCKTVSDFVPATGGVFAVLRDSSLGYQSSATATRQFTTWRVQSMTISLEDGGAYSFLPNGSCAILAAALVDGSPNVTCGGSAWTLEATGAARNAVVRLDLVGMETISARRPSLPDEEDYDGDGVKNRDDNCRLVWNPGQEIFGDPAVGKPGIACAAPDGNGDPAFPDQDNDGVRDSIDNCLWYPNPLLPGDSFQTDVNRNGIGDLCEVMSPISLPAGRLSLECPGTFTLASGSLSSFVVDFTDALTCDVDYGNCTLDATAVTMRLSNELAAAARACAVVADPPSR